ncbi:mitochondrial carrier [Thelephora ganbajun]|uniref:Mitochondrial carrier n=1 Tax=Thelephora ganbajun TaxID=370292 RepID=A0ACB6ZHV8_THEGA|nr:mitochondrial carrier [Thelephora ganbajun]
MTAKKEKPLHSLIAGATAGRIELPTEFVKTRSQFGGKRESPLSIIRTTLKIKGITGLYSGCTALAVGNSAKAGVRFVSYDRFKRMLADSEVPGMTEAIFAITPSETIKTKLIDEAKRPVLQYRGLIHGTAEIVKAEGLRWLQMMRQGTNSAGATRGGQELPAVVTFGIGGIVGLVTVYTTMPLEARMQSLEAKSQYRNSFHCAYSIFTEEGVLRFWTGTTPRLVRLVLSGGVVFTVYEKAIAVIGGRS